MTVTCTVDVTRQSLALWVSHDSHLHCGCHTTVTCTVDVTRQSHALWVSHDSHLHCGSHTTVTCTMGVTRQSHAPGVFCMAGHTHIQADMH